MKAKDLIKELQKYPDDTEVSAGVITTNTHNFEDREHEAKAIWIGYNTKNETN